MLSGTSLDGIDVGIVDLRPRGDGYAVELLSFDTVPFDERLRARIVDAYPPAAIDTLELSALHADIGDAFGEALRTAARGRRVDLVASHGVTIAHDNDARRTLQIGDAFRIRERAGVTVAYDFRSADTAAGGTGAPLVPYVDAMLLGSADEDRVALNLGGIGNLTVLRRAAAPRESIAFDSGPANLPIDTYVALRTNGAMRFDRNGDLARRGTFASDLVCAMTADPYFTAPPPKSTGREQFGAPFIARFRAQLDALEFADAVATLSEVTVRTVADAIEAYAPAGARVIVSGGGARNRTVIEKLTGRLRGRRIALASTYGVDLDAKEAIAFAVLGYELVRGRPAGLPNVTGARAARLLGALAPVNLEALMAALRREEGR